MFSHNVFDRTVTLLRFLQKSKVRGNERKLNTVSGTFLVGEKIVGSTSKAIHTIRLTDLNPPEDGYADNFNIETEADAILDFTEANPFGTP